ncbi:FAD-binding oxidoreductase [Poseidonocella sp. HB161398]|uniref:NAD(P)/FAD-dependent oxidoreductase n=1 Tax=Poseidonocella sp. HB161398 TaxID=2320855 RepID=UPI0011091DB5|nr:FAD-binding oxidoreductase [Poseidonocella sp. HB161398]
MTAPAPKSDPYWWEAARPAPQAEAPLPERADVVIVGAGYAGLGAAIPLARAGRSVVVLEAQDPGYGASSRNGGITSGNLRPSLSDLAARFGEAGGAAIEMESKAAREDLWRFIEEEQIDCDFQLTGRFSGALTPAEYETKARAAEALAKRLGIESYAVPKEQVRGHIDTDFYCGGEVRMDIGGLHPAKFVAGMLRVARAAGAEIHGRTPVTAMTPQEGGHLVETARGSIRAREVIVCTNGYTDKGDPWLRQRLVSVRSRIIATEPLAPEVMARLFPTRMMMSDGRKLSYYYRPSPDFTRVLFGGRDSTLAGEPSGPTRHLARQLAMIFPELEGVGLTHSWQGHVAMNRDMLPRVFDHQGRHYATGFCGSGVVWARWAGQKAALALLGETAGETAFRFRAPKLVPVIGGKAWFMPGVFAWYGAQDRKLLKGRA